MCAAKVVPPVGLVGLVGPERDLSHPIKNFCWGGEVVNASNVTKAEWALLCAVRECANGDGWAVSLFRVAVVVAGVDYAHAHNRLYHLAARGFVEVMRVSQKGRPLAIRVLESVEFSSSVHNE